MAGLIIDLLLLATIITFVAINYKKGVFRSFKLLRLVVTVVMAANYRSEPNLTYLITEKFHLNKFREHTQAYFMETWGDKLSESATASDFDSIFGWFGNMFPSIKDYAFEMFTEKTEEYANIVTNHAANVITSALCQAICFVIIFIVVYLVLLLIMKIVEVCLNNGPLKTVNRILGGVVGLLFGVLIAWAASWVIVFVTSGGQIDGGIGIMKLIYNHCPLSKLFGFKPI